MFSRFCPFVVTVGVACDDFQTGASPSEIINFGDYVYPFENIVFEGGGNKGLAYAGAVRVRSAFYLSIV